ncbi:hypothetical protein N7497_006181 [Penicillium chrysogenum]|nr:hypothetical protein N7497_006181 [Penicillium chrysogenum]
MNIYARVQSNIMSWKHDTPLPTDVPADPKFQPWHQYDANSQQWDPVSANENAEPAPARTDDTPGMQKRVTEILAFITQLDTKVDVIFFQEVSQRVYD